MLALLVHPTEKYYSNCCYHTRRLANCFQNGCSILLCFSTSNGGVLSYNKEGVLPADELFVEFGESLLPTVRGLDNECCKFLDLGTFLSLENLTIQIHRVQIDADQIHFYYPKMNYSNGLH